MVLVASTLLSMVAGAADVPWPADHEGLLFAYASAPAAQVLPGLSPEDRAAWKLRPRGAAWLDHAGALRCASGGFSTPDTPGWADALRASRSLTFVLRVTPDNADTSGPVLRLGGESPLLTIDQTVGHLAIGAGGNAPTEIPITSQSVVLGVIIDQGQLTIFANGETVAPKPIDIPDAAWDAVALAIGKRDGADTTWSGAVDHLALYGRALTSEQLATITSLPPRPAEERLRVRARLTGQSTIPTPESIAPYRQGLCVFRYDVVEVLEGAYAATTLHVAHWLVLDGAPLPFGRISMGTELELDLEPFDRQPQLQTEFLADDIVEDFSLPYYFDARGLSTRSLAELRKGGTK